MADFYMKNIRDWRDATIRLTFEQKGYFTEILELIYLYDDRLPDNDDLICKAMPISKTLHKRLKKSLIELGVMEIKEGYYFNKRCTEELEKINTLSEKNRDKSKKRWKKSRKLNGKSLNSNNKANAAGMLKVKVNSEVKREANASPKKLGAQDVVDLWNKVCPSLGKVIKITDNRRQKINERTKEDFNELEDWKKYFVSYERSNFLTGRIGNWKATFDWSLVPRNMVKVIEGNYGNDSGGFDVAEYSRRKQENED
mgnify:CR=1 FL=1